ncbi:GHKL domain-containing protein [Pedobacter sp. MC2016-14]|uniref:sensor histidine kinase n=1 Tax=Pedobacter sp. MC2016-14 TaxID=2897327 RepID=UPI001E6450AE|nr:7TM diverse intracellular signaling domain-containing protein [Pedobacter sp. MC2016-14]MCD0489574.1 GHKL domain-containing protein [Pedobacter sp. MC2016-14]
MLKFTFVFILCIISNFSYSFDRVLNLNDNQRPELIGTYISYLEDKDNTFTFNEVLKAKNFITADKEIVNFQVSPSTFWLKFTVKNDGRSTDNLLEIIQPLLEEIYLYTPLKNGQYHLTKQGEKFPFYQRTYTQSVNFLFKLNLAPGETKTFYLKVRGHKQILLPIKIIKSDTLSSEVSDQTLWFGIYCGIILVMFLYNLFVYFSIRDKSYLYYVLHTLFIGITQASLTGFTYKYIWSESPWFGNFSVFLLTCLVSIVGVQFLIEFMHMKKIAKKLFILLKIFQLIYVIFIITSLLGFYSLTFKQILSTQSIVAVAILGISVYLYRKGYAEAKYYLIGWTSLMIGIVVYVLKDYGIIPYNTITAYAILFGSAAEVTLLSFALADKINIFKKDKERSQEETLKALQENERIIREQNAILEEKVMERTEALEQTNHTLNDTLYNLKEAQSQLVDSEKMASLGQLTAGIAHEINNPINFVTSNIKPLELDINDLNEVISMYEKLDYDGDLAKQISSIESFKRKIDIHYVREEIKSLLSGIGDGAKRTAEIIRSLKNFSRLDENDTKPVDLNEGLDSTLVLIKSTFPSYLSVVKNYQELPEVECMPGKINQVFMNLITNAVQAIKSKPQHNAEEFITITTWKEDQYVKISIKDSGTGMPDEVKQKIFEPFFTTKDVGEGTGLGLSIVFRIIESHHGNIDVQTKINEGTEFIITLPLNNR